MTTATSTSNMTTPSAAALDAYREDFRAFESNGAGSAPAWLKELRRSAMEHFVRQGFPTNKHEEWRFTNILPLTKVRFSHAGPEGAARFGAGEAKRLRFGTGQLLLLVDGHMAAPAPFAANLPPGASAGSLLKAIGANENGVKEFLNRNVPIDRSTFAALNTVFLHDGVYIRVPRGMSLPEPLEILHLTTGKGGDRPLAAYPRVLIVLEEGASATIVETFRSLGEGASFTNAVTELFVAEGAQVDYLKVQEESESAYHIGALHAHQAGKSRLTAFSFALGAAIARNDLAIDVGGEGAETMLDGLYITAGRQLTDHHTVIDHRHPGCSSREIFRGIIAGESRAVFNGKIFVRQAAQKTDSKQTNKNLLLSEKATVDTKPQLEIFADDVKCTHGATVGGLDESSLFYAKSRGLGEETARGILTVGFASDVTKLINDPELRKRTDALVIRALQGRVVSSDLPEIVH